MKDRILNICMLAMVTLALLLSLRGGEQLPVPALKSALVTHPAPTDAPPLQQYRMERQQSRQQLLQALTALQENKEMDGSLRQAAAEQLLSLSPQWETELALEAALAAKGYEGICVMEQGKITIFLTGELSDREAALLQGLIREWADVEAENIRIAPC